MTDRMPTNPELLHWAPRCSGRTLEGLSGRFKKQGEWLDGRVLPTLNQLEDFARATHSAIGYFFFPIRRKKGCRSLISAPCCRRATNSPVLVFWRPFVCDNAARLGTATTHACGAIRRWPSSVRRCWLNRQPLWPPGSGSSLASILTPDVHLGPRAGALVAGNLRGLRQRGAPLARRADRAQVQRGGCQAAGATGGSVRCAVVDEPLTGTLQRLALAVIVSPLEGQTPFTDAFRLLCARKSRTFYEVVRWLGIQG